MRIRNLIVAASLSLCGGAPAFAIDVGEVMPGIDIAKVDAGTTLTNTGLNGKITMINFWATWCAACKTELIEMEDQLKPYLNDDNFQVAFVSLDKEPAKAAEWFQANLKEPALFLKHLYSDAKFAAADTLKVDSFPLTLVIGRDGKIAHLQRGFKDGEGSTAQIVKVSTELLKNAH